MRQLNQEFFNSVTKDKPVAEGLRRVYEEIATGLREKTFKAEQAVPSFKQLGLWLGALDPLDVEGSWRRIRAETANNRTEEGMNSEQANLALFTESNLAIRSHAFTVLTAELISSVMLDKFESIPSIADSLMTVSKATRRRQRIAGTTHLGTKSSKVLEGHPYPSTDFSEKFVTTDEDKFGQMLELTEELLFDDQTGEIYSRANMLAEGLREEMEEYKIRLLVDADSGSGTYVYRPSGIGQALYNTNGSNMNYIGSGSVAGFNAASPLVDWTDLDLVRLYRATKVVTDSIDGTPRPVGGINNGLVLLVPEGLRSTADNIVYANQVGYTPSSSGGIETKYANPGSGFISRVVSTPYLDSISPADYYIGNFAKQFTWTEVWPLRTAVQGRDSEAAFNTDVIFRIKASWYGGLTARDSRYVTKIDGV